MCFASNPDDSVCEVPKDDLCEKIGDDEYMCGAFYPCCTFYNEECH